MLKGFNFLFGQKQKLGSWTSYLHIRDTILEVNEQFRGLFSKDLGAISGLLFEIGTGRLAIEQHADLVIDKEREKLLAARQKASGS